MNSKDFNLLFSEHEYDVPVRRSERAIQRRPLIENILLSDSDEDEPIRRNERIKKSPETQSQFSEKARQASSSQSNSGESKENQVAQFLYIKNCSKPIRLDANGKPIRGRPPGKPKPLVKNELRARNACYEKCRRAEERKNYQELVKILGVEKQKKITRPQIILESIKAVKELQDISKLLDIQHAEAKAENERLQLKLKELQDAPSTSEINILIKEEFIANSIPLAGDTQEQLSVDILNENSLIWSLPLTEEVNAMNPPSSDQVECSVAIEAFDLNDADLGNNSLTDFDIWKLKDNWSLDDNLMNLDPDNPT